MSVCACMRVGVRVSLKREKEFKRELYEKERKRERRSKRVGGCENRGNMM